MPRKISKYKETKWKRIFEEDMTIQADKNSPLGIWTANLANGQYLIPTPVFVPQALHDKKLTYKYYVIDQWDLHIVQKMYQFELEQWQEYTPTLSTLVSHIHKTYNYKKTMYLRAIKPLRQSSSEVWTEEKDAECRVFAEEVFDVIQMLRLQQKEPLKANDSALTKLNKRWSSLKFKNFQESYATITLAELEAVLDEFECDKSMVAIVDDPVQILSLRETLQHGTPLKLMCYDTQWVLSAEQSVLHMTQALICGADWRRNTAKEKRMVVNRVIEPLSMKDGVYVLLDKISAVVLELKKHLFDNLYKDVKPIPRNQLMPRDPDDKVKSSMYTKAAHDFGLKVYDICREPQLPVYVMRILLVIGWLDSMNAGKDFYNYSNLRSVIIGAMMPWIPVDSRPLLKEYLIASVNEKTPEEREELERQQFLAENGHKESCEYCEQFKELLNNTEKERDDDRKAYDDLIVREKKVYGKREYVLTTNEDVKELRKELEELEGEEHIVDSLLKVNERLLSEQTTIREHLATINKELEETIRETKELKDQNNNLRIAIKLLEKQLGEDEKNNDAIAENGTSDD